MSSTLVIILFSVGALALFVVGMSLTLIFKGHNIKSEIGENEHMKERGIKCVIQEAREQESATEGCPDDQACGEGECRSRSRL